MLSVFFTIFLLKFYYTCILLLILSTLNITKLKAISKGVEITDNTVNIICIIQISLQSVPRINS